MVITRFQQPDTNTIPHYTTLLYLAHIILLDINNTLYHDSSSPTLLYNTNHFLYHRLTPTRMSNRNRHQMRNMRSHNRKSSLMRVRPSHCRVSNRPSRPLFSMFTQRRPRHRSTYHHNRHIPRKRNAINRSKRRRVSSNIHHNMSYNRSYYVTRKHVPSPSNNKFYTPNYLNHFKSYVTNHLITVSHHYIPIQLTIISPHRYFTSNYLN